MSSGPYTRSKARRDKINVVDKNREEEEDEFPILKELGLYASAIKGDGNCLFRSLSDQLYGDAGKRHAELRLAVVEYMSEHGDYFSKFVGSGESWPSYLNRMKQDGVYGDNLEIVAFARRYGVDVVIYQYDYKYVVVAREPQESKSSNKQVHIVYHSWEHYSSVRNLEGPHQGLPEVRPKEGKGDHFLPGSSKPKTTASWKLDVVKKSLPFALDDDVIKSCLEKHGGDISGAVEELIMSDAPDIEGPEDQQGPEYLKVSVGKEVSDFEVGENGSSVKLDDKQSSDDKGLSTVTKGGRDRRSGATNAAARRPKRMSAREKKEKQKKQALERKRANKESTAGPSSGSRGFADTVASKESSASASSIRSMYI